MQKVDLKPSSNIMHAWYSAATLKLVVTFTSGKSYEYYRVPNEVIDTWERVTRTAKGSVGSFYYHFIKSKYPHTP